ncbi:hypothetical protein ACFLQV_01055, partial [Calditrichota bacterium]
MNNMIKLAILSLFSITSVAFSQPQTEFIYTFADTNGQIFYDVYATANGSFVACGKSGSGNVQNDRGIVVKIDENGEEEWHIKLGMGRSILYSIIELDDGSYVAGGLVGDGVILLVNITADGALEWVREYDDGECQAIIEMKNGDLALAGRTLSDRAGMVMRLDIEDGELLWRSEVGDNYSSYYYGLRESDQSLFAGGWGITEYGYPLNLKFILGKYSQDDGELEWLNEYDHSDRDQAYALTSHENGFVLSGVYKQSDDGGDEGQTIMIDGDGEETWQVHRQPDEEHYGGLWWGNCRGMDDQIIQVGIIGYNTSEPTMNIIDGNGDELYWYTFDASNLGDFVEGSGWFRSVVLAQDNGIVICGRLTGEDGITYATILKLEPFLFDLTFVRHTPEDTSLFVLQDDTLRFSAFAKDMFGDAESYLWLRNYTDTLSTDTTVLVEFPELGVDTISCTAVREDQSVTRRWLVSVREMYIESYTPDSLDLMLRRGTTVDFNVIARAGNPDNIEYQWTLSDQLDNVLVISDSASAAYSFNYSMWYT